MSDDDDEGTSEEEISFTIRQPAQPKITQPLPKITQPLPTVGAELVSARTSPSPNNTPLPQHEDTTSEETLDMVADGMAGPAVRAETSSAPTGLEIEGQEEEQKQEAISTPGEHEPVT